MLPPLLKLGLVLMLTAAPVAARETGTGSVTAGGAPRASQEDVSPTGPSGAFVRRALQSGLAIAVLVALARHGRRRDAAPSVRRPRQPAPASSISW